MACQKRCEGSLTDGGVEKTWRVKSAAKIKLVTNTQRTKEHKQRTQWEETQKLHARNDYDDNKQIAFIIEDAIEIVKRQFGERLSTSNTLADIIAGTAKLLNDTERLAMFVTTPKYAMGLSNFASDLYVLVKTNGLFSLERYIGEIDLIPQLWGGFKLDQDIWVKPLFPFLVFLREVEQFYRFLSEIKIRLSQLDVQLDKSLYNVQNIEDWGMPSKPQGISISEDTFDNFVEKVSTSFNLSDAGKGPFANLREKYVWEINILHLNLLLQITLDTTQQCETLDSSIICRGPFIFASKLESTSQINNLYVLASHSLFLDSDLAGTMFNTEYGVHMSLISQNWSSRNQTTVNLSPSDNTKLPPAAEGMDGMLGLFGRNCRSFFGISEYFHGDMTIILNGGRGGEGQQGGQGNASEKMTQNLYGVYKDMVQWDDMATPTLDDRLAGIGYPCIAGKQQNVLGYPDFLIRYDKGNDSSLYQREDVNDRDDQRLEMLNRSKHIWEFKYEGKVGGPGADGGSGGLGGLPGRFYFNKVGTPFDLRQIKVLNETGETGIVGVGGQGAQTEPPWGNFTWVITYDAKLKDCHIWNLFYEVFKYPKDCHGLDDCLAYAPADEWPNRPANPYECCKFDGYMRPYDREVNLTQGEPGLNGTLGSSLIEQNDTREALFDPAVHLKGLSLFKSYVYKSQTIFSGEALTFVKQFDDNEDLVKLYTIESVYEEIKTFLSESGSYKMLKRYRSSLDSLSGQLTEIFMNKPNQIHVIALNALLHAVRTNLMFDFNEITPSNFSQRVDEEQLFVDSIRTMDTSEQLLQLVKKTEADLNREALYICLENLNVTSMLSLNFKFDAFYTELGDLMYLILELAKNPEGNAKRLVEKRAELILLLAKFPSISAMRTSGRVANFLAILNCINLLVLPLFKDPTPLNDMSDSGSSVPLQMPNGLVTMIEDETYVFTEAMNLSMTGLRQKVRGLHDVAVDCRYCVSVADKIGQSQAEFKRFNDLLDKKLARFEENMTVDYATVFTLYIESQAFIRKQELRLLEAIQADLANVISKNTTGSQEEGQLRNLLSIVNIPGELYHMYINNVKALRELATATDASVLEASTSAITLDVVKNFLPKASHQYEACATAISTGNSVSFKTLTTSKWGINHVVGQLRHDCDRYLVNVTKTTVNVAEYALILDYVLPSLELAFTKYELVLEVKLVSNNVHAVVSSEKRSKDEGSSNGGLLGVNRIIDDIGTTVLKTRATLMLKSLENVIFPLSVPYRLGPINRSTPGVPLKDALTDYGTFLLNVRKSVKEYKKETEVGETLVHNRELTVIIWRYYHYRYSKEIERLMQGKRVFLISTIAWGIHDGMEYEAVKTRKLWLKMTPLVDNATDSHNMETILKGLYLEITYYARSGYKVQNKYVAFKTMRETYRRLLQDDETGRPVGCNTLCSEMYDKVSLRSPYNLLQVQLIAENGSNALEQLSQYKYVDVHLMGEIYATNVSWTAYRSEPYQNEQLPLHSIIYDVFSPLP